MERLSRSLTTMGIQVHSCIGKVNIQMFHQKLSASLDPWSKVLFLKYTLEVLILGKNLSKTWKEYCCSTHCFGKSLSGRLL